MLGVTMLRDLPEQSLFVACVQNFLEKMWLTRCEEG